MLESGFQKKIIRGIQEEGGVAINGKYTIAGTADLICGYLKIIHYFIYM